MNRMAPSTDFELLVIALVSSLLGVLAAWSIAVVTANRDSPGGVFESLPGEKSPNAETLSQRINGPIPGGDSIGSPTDSLPLMRTAEKNPLVSCPETPRSVKRLLRDAHVRPAYQQGIVRGFQLSEVAKGSFWEALGLFDGDIVVGMDGLPIVGLEDRTKLINYVAESDRGELTVRKLDGGNWPIYWDTPSATVSAKCR